MRYVSDISCRENQNTHFVFSNFWKLCRLRDNVEKYCGAKQAINDNMTCALHAGYLRLRTHRFALPGQQFLCESASMFYYTYNACLWYGLTAHGEMQQADNANILTPVMAQQKEWRVLQSCTKMQIQSLSTHRQHAAVTSQTVRYVTIKFIATKRHRNV